MILSDRTIRKELAAGRIAITPQVSESDVRSTGIRLHLGDCLLLPQRLDEEIDLHEVTDYGLTKFRMNASGYVLTPGAFALGQTSEAIKVSPDFVGLIDGRSSLARCGLQIHCTSFTMDCIHGDPRVAVLELYNCGIRPLRLRPGLPIAMLLIAELSESIEQLPSAQYSRQSAVMGPTW